MKFHRSLTLIATGIALGSVPILWAASSQESKPGTKQDPASTTTTKPTTTKITGSTLWPAGELKWTPMTGGIEGAEQATLWGDPTKEAHGVLYKWPAGTKAPMHTHTFGDRGVVVSGTLSLATEGGTAKKLPPGSFFSFGGGVKHSTAVEGEEECVFFITREGKFDVTMAEDAGAKKDKEK